MSYQGSMFYIRLLILVFMSCLFLASCENSRQTQNTSSEESILKNEPLESPSPGEKDTVNAIVVPGESRKETPRPEDVDEGETGSVSRFPENIEDYEPEDITEYPDKTPKDPLQDPEAPVTNSDQK